MSQQAPGPGMIEFALGVRRCGLLDYVGTLFRTYGDVFQVRMGPKRIVCVMHPDAVEHINLTNRQNYEKRASYDAVRDFLVGDGIVASNGELWRRQRKLMAPFYTPKAIQTYADMMLGDALRLAETWGPLAASGQEVDMHEQMTLVTASIILKAMFSKESSDAVLKMKDAAGRMLAIVNDRMMGLPIPTWLPTAKNRSYHAARKLSRQVIESLIAERRAMDEATWPDDLLSRMMKARDEETGEAMSARLLHDETLTIYFAGHETTARSLTFAWYALAANPQVTERLHAELDRVLAGRVPTLDDLRQLPYTLQVIKEVLRLHPAVTVYARDAVGDDVIGGYAIPAGASVLLWSYYTHRHPDFWPHPQTFDPERFTREHEAARHHHAYHPFAAGPRICLGNNFSLLESHLLLAVLAARYTARLRPGYKPRWIMDGTLGLANGLPMSLSAR